MKKLFLASLLTFMTLTIISCTKEDDTSNNPPVTASNGNTGQNGTNGNNGNNPPVTANNGPR
jgi:hypothetical protein